MTRGEVLNKINNGLTSDKLSYFVRAGYLNPKKIQHGDLIYNDFSEEDVTILEIAWKYIHDQSMRTKAAFQKAKAEITKENHPKYVTLPLWERG